MSVAFCMLAGPADAGFAETILRHLLRASAFDFHKVIFTVDDLPNRKYNSSEIRALADRLVSEGVITDRVLLSEIDHASLTKKYFGKTLRHRRDHRGVPLLGWAAGIEQSDAQYVVHYDSDILLHQQHDANWIRSGIALLEKEPTVMFVAPRPGPPTADGQLLGQATQPRIDAAGNFWFKTFSSRRFLVDKNRLEGLLPTPIVPISPKRALLDQLGIGNPCSPWEASVDRKLVTSSYHRVHLGGGGWSLHCPNHGIGFRETLPEVVAMVEQGYHPADQAGQYDLKLESWLPLLTAAKTTAAQSAKATRQS